MGESWRYSQNSFISGPKYFVQQGSIYSPGWHVRERVRDNFLVSLGCFPDKAGAEEYLQYILAEKS